MDRRLAERGLLKLNIWTSSLTGKRPVMFYIHGGGFTFGSPYELISHDGAQMARHHDVVSGQRRITASTSSASSTCPRSAGRRMPIR